MQVPLACGVSYWSKCGLSISYWSECRVLVASHWSRNGVCPKYQLVGKISVSKVSEGWYSGDPAGGWSKTWVTACVPGTSWWGGKCLYLPQTGCVWGVLVYSLANLKLDQPAKRRSWVPGERAQAGIRGDARV